MSPVVCACPVSVSRDFIKVATADFQSDYVSTFVRRQSDSGDAQRTGGWVAFVTSRYLDWIFFFLFFSPPSVITVTILARHGGEREVE